MMRDSKSHYGTLTDENTCRTMHWSPFDYQNLGTHLYRCKETERAIDEVKVVVDRLGDASHRHV